LSKVFAPTDQAFMKLGATNLDFLRSDVARATLERVLSHHILLTTLPTTILSEGSTTISQTLDPSRSLSVTKNGDTVVVNETATVVENDLLANNGIVHLIDTVLSLEFAVSPTLSPLDETFTMTPTTGDMPTNDQIPSPTSSSKPYWHPLWYCSFLSCFILWGWYPG